MVKISFGKTVKYQGSIYPPNTFFEVLDSDVESLKKAGGWVIEESKDIKEKETTKQEKSEQKSELELLREKADKLGIEYKNNWGVKKLTEVINEIQEVEAQ
mgnify:CR=1 FL=1